MKQVIIKEDEIEMADSLDAEGDMEIEINNGDINYAWINKDQAIKVIKHLEIVFGISS